MKSALAMALLLSLAGKHIAIDTIYKFSSNDGFELSMIVLFCKIAGSAGCTSIVCDALAQDTVTAT